MAESHLLRFTMRDPEESQHGVLAPLLATSLRRVFFFCEQTQFVVLVNKSQNQDNSDEIPLVKYVVLGGCDDHL